LCASQRFADDDDDDARLPPPQREAQDEARLLGRLVLDDDDDDGRLVFLSASHLSDDDTRPGLLGRSAFATTSRGSEER
jgi:hypothetical protein